MHTVPPFWSRLCSRSFRLVSGSLFGAPCGASRPLAGKRGPHRCLVLTCGLLGLPTVVAAGANHDGYLVVHTDESIVYTWDDVDDYAHLSFPQCPPHPCEFDTDEECSQAQFDLDVTSERPPEEPTVFWVLAAFSYDVCPRVSAAAFGLDWEVDGSEPTFVGWGNCGDAEFSLDDWPVTPESGTVVTFSRARTERLLPLYWFAAFSYYGATTISIASHPTEGTARFADDAIPSQLDPVPRERRGSLGLGGAWGTNPVYGWIPTERASWGEIKARFFGSE